MPVIDSHGYGIHLNSRAKLPIEEGLGRANVTISSGSYSVATRTITLNLSDGRMMICTDQSSDDWQYVKAWAGI